MTASLDTYEIARRTYGLRGDGISALRVFDQIPRALAPGLVPPRCTPWPDASDPVMWEYNLIDNQDVGGTMRLFLYYKNLTIEDVLDVYNPKGILLTRGATQTRRISQLDDGTVIEGMDPSDVTGQTAWQLASGDNLTHEGLGYYRIHAVVADVSWRDPYIDKLTSGYGSYNTTAMFGRDGGTSRPPGTLLFAAMSFVPRRRVSPLGAFTLYTADYDFIYRPQGWDDPCISMELVRQALRVAVVQDGTAVTPAETRDIAAWVPSGTTRETNLLHGENFSNLNAITHCGMMIWV